MVRAADDPGTTRAPGILATMPAAPDTTPDDDRVPSVWDNEGGHLAESRTRRPTVSCPPPVRAENPVS